MNPIFDYAGRLLIGEVVANEIGGGLQQGEVRVAIPAIYGSTPNNLLPVAFHLKNDCGGARSVGVFPVGAKVIVELQDGDPQFPIVRCRVSDNVNIPAEFLSDYPDVYGWYDEVGNIFLVNKRTRLIKFTDGAGATITIQNGNITGAFQSAIINAATANVNCTGQLGLKSDVKIKLEAPMIEEN